MSPDTVEFADRVMDMYNAPYARDAGIEISRISRDEVVCTMELKPHQMNSHGRAHGAAIYVLLDHTFAIATNLTKDCTGQNTNVSFHRPGFGKLTAIATPINRSRSLEIYDVRVMNEDGKLVASSVCTAFVLKKEE